jgi:hypothetical protein
MTMALAVPRELHSATLLPDGRVLIAGGGAFGAVASAELYDPSSGAFTAAGDMVNWVNGPAILLANGKVLIAHDLGPSSAATGGLLLIGLGQAEGPKGGCE